jgi:hypothetical protein
MQVKFTKSSWKGNKTFEFNYVISQDLDVYFVSVYNLDNELRFKWSYRNMPLEQEIIDRIIRNC